MVKQRLKACIYALMAAVVCLSAANGSVLLCLHPSGELHAPSENHEGDHAEPASTCESELPCCEAQRDLDCVDLQIDGLSLEFSVDQAKVLTPAVLDLGGLYWSELLAAPTVVDVAQLPTRAPPIAGPRVHVSVPSTVLRL